MSTETAMTRMKVERIRTDHGSHIEPPLDDAWSDETKLQWLAGVVEVDSGLLMEVADNGPCGCYPKHGASTYRLQVGNYITHSRYLDMWWQMTHLSQGVELWKKQSGGAR